LPDRSFLKILNSSVQDVLFPYSASRIAEFMHGLLNKSPIDENLNNLLKSLIMESKEDDKEGLLKQLECACLGSLDEGISVFSDRLNGEECQLTGEKSNLSQKLVEQCQSWIRQDKKVGC
jgi:hypothetical protein